ncbi:hypothetical protein V7968_15385 [Nocardia vulneris]|uniref:hypothetical protein n=1 Tax=Nocardia vulneris TaxID=1141657 RepID=UPI0030CDD648
MKSRKKYSLARMALCLPFAAALLLSMSAPAGALRGTTPPTPLRIATPADMIDTWYPMSYNWLAVQNPAGKEKLLITFALHNFPAPQLISIITAPDGSYYNALDYALDPYVITADPITVRNSRFSWSFAPEREAWHLVLNDPMTQIGVPGAVADLWFYDTKPGAAMTDVDWDGQKVFWASTLGAAKVDGWIRFPGQAEPTVVQEWAGEQERMAGYFDLVAGHKGYEYAQASNPDGSADQLFAFPQKNGDVRGVLAHTGVDGSVTMCEPDHVELADWTTEFGMDRGAPVAPLDYPRTIRSSCTSGDVHLARTFTVTEQHVHPLRFGPTDFTMALTTMADGHSDVPGSVATIQHLRNLGWERQRN